MDNNSSGPQRKGSASEALNGMKRDRQRVSNFSQTNKPRIQQNQPQKSNNDNDEDDGCGSVILYIVFFIIGLLIMSML